MGTLSQIHDPYRLTVDETRVLRTLKIEIGRRAADFRRMREAVRNTDSRNWHQLNDHAGKWGDYELVLADLLERRGSLNLPAEIGAAAMGAILEPGDIENPKLRAAYARFLDDVDKMRRESREIATAQVARTVQRAEKEWDGRRTLPA